MHDVSLIHPLMCLAFPGFNFLALGFLLLFALTTDCSPLFSRVYSGFSMTVYVLSRFQVTTCASFVSTLFLFSCPFDFCYFYLRTALICIPVSPVVYRRLLT